MDTDDTIEELRAYLDDKADADQPAGASAPIPNEEMRLLMGLDRLVQERNSYASMVDRLQSTLDRVLSKAEALQAENERLRHELKRYVNAAADEATAIAQETGQYDEWLTHGSHQPPDDLAPAQLVYVECNTPLGLCSAGPFRVCETNWQPGLRYRPALSASGLPLVSAEGLDHRIRYVVTQPGGLCFGLSSKPRFMEGIVGSYWSEGSKEDAVVKELGSEFRRPGPASESLMEVHRD